LLVAHEQQRGGAMLVESLKLLKDTRRKQGTRYDVGGIVTCSILAILSNATSYRKIHIFIKTHFEKLKDTFNLKWKKAPSYIGIRKILQGLDKSSLEEVQRDYSRRILEENKKHGLETRYLSCDGKVLRGSFDAMHDKKAAQILSIFCNDANIVIAQEDIAQKTNEIPVLQQLIDSLGLKDKIFLFDALHTQKKL
jgi:DDE_Tnp_1-associated